MGKKIVEYDMSRDKPTDAELEKILIGRSGTMRAPCLEAGDSFVGGFEPGLYKKLLKIK